MKSSFTSIKKHLMMKYTLEDENLNLKKSTNINVLLNRVKQDQKNESRKKILFSAVTSIGLVLFGVLIF
tara:strand:+ start:193 stop:399 length:207 start_codon:yes stop_codon:yes gene_type:complete